MEKKYVLVTGGSKGIGQARFCRFSLGVALILKNRISLRDLRLAA